jgi:uncharacterized protein (DUF302 family)
MTKIFTSHAILLLALLHSTLVNAHEQQDFYSVTTNKTLQDVLEDTEFAITEHNIRITGRLHIGKTIQERGKAEFPNYEIIMYCSLAFAEKMLELSPHYINSCPGRITVREENEHLVITAPLWPEDISNLELKQHMQKMNNIVREIVDFAAKNWLYEK